MRIIAGEWRGRRLQAPPGLSTRPTADRVRETLFSMLASRIGSFEGLRVADLFAGSGALGLEALSRGASFACFVESDADAAAAIKANADALGAAARVTILRASALALPKAEAFDLIFADPPYDRGSGTRAASAVSAAGWLSQGGLMAIETARGEAVDPDALALEVARDVGSARLTLLRSP